MRRILLAIPEELLFEVDEGAKEEYMSRTEYIRSVLKKEVGGRYPEQKRTALSDEPWRFADLDDS